MDRLFEYLESWISPEKPRKLGELELGRSAQSGFFARHHCDSGLDIAELKRLNTVEEVREMTRYDEAGEYRPLKTAPSLKRGWVIVEESSQSFYRMIDAVYPAVLAGTIRYFEGRIDAFPLRATLDRQTGMYRFANNITDGMANAIMRDTCAKGCLRTIAWPISDECPVSRLKYSESGPIPLLCTEACTFAVTEARRLAREAYDRENAPKD